MRKKYGTASPSLSEKALLNLGHYHHANENHLVRLAQDEGDPYLVAPFAQRLSELLADTAVRALSGDPDLVPPLSQNSSAIGRRGRHQVRDVYQSAQDLPDRSSGKRTLSRKARKAIGKAQRERWAAYNDRKDRDRARWRRQKKSQRDEAAPQGLSARGTPRKVNLTQAQLRAMRANAKKARAAKGKKRRAPMSAEQRAQISAARKAYWARLKAGAA